MGGYPLPIRGGIFSSLSLLHLFVCSILFENNSTNPRLHVRPQNTQPIYIYIITHTLRYRRYLKALFGISQETVDNIRYNDKGNRRHLSLIPSTVIRPWIESHTHTQTHTHTWMEGRSGGTGQMLPGYNDAQTLLMLGECVCVYI